MGDIFFPQPTTKPEAIIYHPTHSGPADKPEDLPFTEWELGAAIQQCRSKSAPGEDGITVSMLRNAPLATRLVILKWFNEIWEGGQLPEEWKLSLVTPIPKPGKPATDPKNVRPISLTSIMGKLMERMVLARIQHNAETLGIFHPTQTGFRSNLCTHDSLYMIYKDVVDMHPGKKQMRVIVSIDIKKAFDSVPHQSVIGKMEQQGLTGKQLDFVKSFLSGRVYKIRAGYDKECGEGTLQENNIGVPQGAVLSPTIFNIVMAPLLWQLYKIPNLRATMYADDITIWTYQGPPETQVVALQKGLDTIAAYLAEVGMFPSPEKTKYTIYGRDQDNKRLGLTFAGDPIQNEGSIKILGINFGYKPRINKAWMAEMSKKWKQGINLVRRISTKMGGAGEKTAKKLVTAVLVSKIAYAARFYRLTKTNLSRFKSMLNGARKTILGLPRHTSAEEVSKCIFLPELTDLMNQQKEAQLSRLQHTTEGRKIAKYMGIEIHEDAPIPPSKPPWELIDVTHGCKPLPRNMDAARHKKRREHHARMHKKELAKLVEDARNMIVYVDASIPSMGWATAATYIQGSMTWTETQGNPRGHHTAGFAEREAVLQAIRGAVPHLQDKQQLIIYTDSQDTIRELKKYRSSSSPTIDAIFASAISLYRSKRIQVNVRWIPGHEGILGNELAHEAAQQAMRNLTQPSLLSQSSTAGSAPQQQDPELPPYDPREELRLAQKARKHLLARSWTQEQHPLPREEFKRKESVMLRRIRTGGAVTPRFRYHMDLATLKKKQPYAVPPDPRCQLCQAEGSIPRLKHLLWECEALSTLRRFIFSKMANDERPSALQDWTHPAGDTPRKTRILRALLEYISEGGLGSSI